MEIAFQLSQGPEWMDEAIQQGFNRDCGVRHGHLRGPIRRGLPHRPGHGHLRLHLRIWLGLFGPGTPWQGLEAWYTSEEGLTLRVAVDIQVREGMSIAGTGAGRRVVVGNWARI